MSAAAAVLPLLWATADLAYAEVPEAGAPGPVAVPAWPLAAPERPQAVPARRTVRRTVPGPELAFYRKYTEGMLRRFVKLSLEAGRTPSLLGRELFRGRVSSCKVRSFDDVVIFVHDMGNCVGKLDTEQQKLIRRIGMQEYTQGEAAAMLGLPLRTTVRRYAEALDRLTQILLEVGMLEPMVECRG